MDLKTELVKKKSKWNNRENEKNNKSIKSEVKTSEIWWMIRKMKHKSLKTR